MALQKEIKNNLLLSWLCTSSAIFGFAWVTMFVAMLLYSHQGSIPERLFPGIAMEYINAGTGFVVGEVLLTLTGLAAVFMMWKKKKSGFYLYSCCKITLYFLPVLIIGSNHLSFLPLALTSLFIVLYGLVFFSPQK